MLEMLITILPLFLLLLLGFVAGFAKRFREAGSGLNVFVFYFSLPAFVYAAMTSASVPDRVPAGVFVIAAAVTVGVSVLTYYSAKLVGRSASETAAQLSLAGTFGNVGYFGIPITIATLGPTAAMAATMIHLIHNIMFLVGYPMVRASVSGRSDNATPRGINGRLWSITRHVLLNPLALAMFAALLVLNTPVETPHLVSESIDMLGATAVPLALFTVGLAMRPAITSIRSGEVPVRSIFLGTATKLLVLPTVTWLCTVLMYDHLGSLWAATLVLMAAMPSATTVFILSDQYDDNNQLAAAILAVSTFCAVLTIPLAAELVQ